MYCVSGGKNSEGAVNKHINMNEVESVPNLQAYRR
jgi:hypothetical protein